MILFILLSNAIKTTEYIWLQTRLFGLLSFFALFLTIVIGELRLLTKIKAKFILFKYHVPLAIFSTILVLLHFISAAFDKFKWGTNLVFTQFLGFSFSDKWLTLLSLGTLALYLMIIVGMTSANGIIQKIGYKKWKFIHYFSYVSFLFAYIHSINLGTDIKTSILSPVLKPVFVIMFFVVVALLITRILNSYKIFDDQSEINLATIFFLVLVIGTVFTIINYTNQTHEVQDLNNKITNQTNDIKLLEEENQQLIQQNQLLVNQIENITNN